MTIRWVKLWCLIFLFCILGAGETFGAENDWKKLQQMQEELERLADENPEGINSAEFNRLADSYVQMLLKKKGENNPGSTTKYVVNPEVRTKLMSGQFVFTLPNEQSYYASVPNGMMITTPVQFIPVENSLFTIKKDGKLMKRPCSNLYSEPGSYEVLMVAYGDGSIKLEEYSVYEVHFYFRIIDNYTKNVNYLYPPADYLITKIKLGGESLPVSGTGDFLLKDGDYEIWYASSLYPQKTYRFRFTRDTKPPDITFQNESADHEYDAPAKFQVSEPLREFSVIYNGMRLAEPSYILQSEGSYDITAADQAGNQTEILVKVCQKYPFGGNLWIIVILIFLAASIGFILYFCKKGIRIL